MASPYAAPTATNVPVRPIPRTRTRLASLPAERPMLRRSGYMRTPITMSTTARSSIRNGRTRNKACATRETSTAAAATIVEKQCHKDPCEKPVPHSLGRSAVAGTFAEEKANRRAPLVRWSRSRCGFRIDGSKLNFVRDHLLKLLALSAGSVSPAPRTMPLLTVQQLLALPHPVLTRLEPPQA